jgi:hypothetical protein
VRLSDGRARLVDAAGGSTLSDRELPARLDQPDARQCLHVTYGSVLTGADATSKLREGLA